MPRLLIPPILLFLAGLLVPCAAGAAPPAEKQGKPVCRCKTVEKDVKKTVYYEKCVPYCQTGCSCCLCRLCGRTCEPVRYKKVLMKKEVVVGRKCETQCVLEHEPCCESGWTESYGVPPAPSAPPAVPNGSPTIRRPLGPAGDRPY